ncbi:MerR family transcriptional regulator [Paraburkholderia sp. USG1]|uniref:MerR family transcriptional regulator n=1 Tax=Paraburkholderia sp. USG1 TaxID=2952268 RepID=UPI0028568D7F|nr:MerR family transcriptional regulator [Paraburkholderia sp. USG1]MDR8398404.1 MerR family transcriptional regulator [Paraburkholderia sp. USG1]
MRGAVKPEASPLTVQQAARRLGVTARTLKYYEEQGLVVPGRSKGRYRLYDETDMERFARILRLRSLGFSIRTVMEMLKRPLDHVPEKGKARYSESSLREIHGELSSQLKLLDERVAAVKRELAEVRKMREELRFDLEYVEGRLAGADVEELLSARRQSRTRRATKNPGIPADNGKPPASKP